MTTEEEIYTLLTLSSIFTPVDERIEHDLRAIGYTLLEILKELKKLNK